MRKLVAISTECRLTRHFNTPCLTTSVATHRSNQYPRWYFRQHLKASSSPDSSKKGGRTFSSLGPLSVSRIWRKQREGIYMHKDVCMCCSSMHAMDKTRGVAARARILPYDILSCRGRALHMENASLITRSVRKEQKTLAKTSEFDQWGGQKKAGTRTIAQRATSLKEHTWFSTFVRFRSEKWARLKMRAGALLENAFRD